MEHTIGVMNANGHDTFLRHARLDEIEAEILNAMAHPIRVRILHDLSEDGTGIARLAERLRLPAATIAEHIHLLWHARLVRAVETDGGRRYEVADARMVETLRHLRSVAAETEVQWNGT